MAKRDFLVDIDLNKNQLLKAKLENLITTDANNLGLGINDAGYMYWDTVLQTARWWTGSAWKALDESANSTLTGPIPFKIAAGKTLGKYVGPALQYIGEAGWTFEQLMRDIALEALAPTASIDITSAQPEYNSTDITNIISFSHTINTQGATLTSAVLSVSRDNSTWTVLSGAVSPYSHVNTNVVDKTSTFYYKYVVTDSVGGTITVTDSITPKAYVAPTLSNTSDSKELGDIVYSANKTVTKQSPNTTLTSWQIGYSLNGGADTLIGTPTNFINQTSTDSISINIANAGGGVGTINGITIPGILNATSIRVYIRVITSVNPPTNLNFLTRSLAIKKFYGTTAAPVVNYRTELTSIPNTQTSITGWYTGGKVHTIALPTGKTLISVDTSNNETVTGNFILNASGSIPDAGGTARTYNIYTYTSAVDFNVTLTAVIQ